MEGNDVKNVPRVTGDTLVSLILLFSSAWVGVTFAVCMWSLHEDVGKSELYYIANGSSNVGRALFVQRHYALRQHT